MRKRFFGLTRSSLPFARGLLGHALLWALSVPALAQQPKKLPRIGVLVSASAAATAPFIDALQQGLRELGYVEGKNIAIERRFAELMGARYGLAVSSGTAALVCGLIGLGIGPGDEVILPAYTYISSAAAILNVRAVPVIAEVDDTLTLDPADVERKITPYTRAIMPVHMRGIPSQMEELLALARRYGLPVIEDTAQACGGSYRGRRLGKVDAEFGEALFDAHGGALGPRTVARQASWRWTEKPPQLWVTGISSIALMLRCGGRLASHQNSSA